MEKVELLAPAGDYQAFLGAISAGADAVYLGGPRFGARAYAKNLTEEEVCSAICYAHLFDKKVYLTINTLIKQSEFELLYSYLAPFYECGLDGVIVQDMGVLSYIKRQFPELALHISTQAMVTGRYGARLMKEAGAVRIVPARELSLREIKEIMSDTGLEIEAFIHGAVCYCYSGQCLLSSTLGGRSGNRGRCAQPCRLPYDKGLQGQNAKNAVKRGIQQTGKYPLSMKDMCTIEMIPKLIEAGIDSFKIEGRMKKPEYAAGVTAIYRKYIDRYYEAPEKPFQVEAEDIDRLSHLYIRSGLQDGYYTKHNGREMLTLTQPGYSGVDEALLGEIQKQYLEKPEKLPVSMSAYLAPGEPVRLTVSARDTNITVTGEIAEAAKSRPLTEAEIKKQLQKTGETPFDCQEIELSLKEAVFLPVKALNALRRQALERLYERLQNPHRRVCEKEQEIGKRPVCRKSVRQSVCQSRKDCQIQTDQISQSHKVFFSAEIQTEEQALAALQIPGLYRLYLPAELLSSPNAFIKCLGTYQRENPDFRLYLALPHIFRVRSEKLMDEVLQKIHEFKAIYEFHVDGMLVRNLEEIAWLQEKGFRGAVQTDASLYSWNYEAEAFFRGLCDHFHADQSDDTDRHASAAGNMVQTTLPLELSGKELAQLAGPEQELIVYGRTPLMQSANCVRQTLTGCVQDSRQDLFWLQDRYHKQFPVRTDCRHCYNVIYNSVPTSLHHYMEEVRQWRCGLRAVFTTESGAETKAVLELFRTLAEGGKWERELPMEEYTSGYFKRGVE